jgi:hypothetical protein
MDRTRADDAQGVREKLGNRGKMGKMGNRRKNNIHNKIIYAFAFWHN